MSELAISADPVAAIAGRLGPSVIGRGRGWDSGSGFVTRPGEVLVATGGARGDHEPVISFADGRCEPARLLGHDAELGVALLAADTGELPALEWCPAAARDDATAIGAPVIAMGDPGGRGLRATLGRISAAPRELRGPGGRRRAGGLEHTAPLPRGSAGGPLVDPRGRLLGVNLLRVPGGFVLAAPADQRLAERLDALRSGTALPTRRLGVAVAPPRVGRRLRRAVGLDERDGLLVRAVEDAGAGARAGVRSGDLLLAAGGTPLDSIDALHEALDATGPGSALELRLLRGTQELSLRVGFEAPAERER